MAKQKQYKGKDDIKDWFNKELFDVAVEINKNLQYKARDVIDYFYDDYTPKQYIRIWDFKSKRFIRTILRRYKDGYICGVVMTSDALYGHRQSKEYVFDSVIDEGIHGKENVYITSPSPSQMMDNYYDNLSLYINLF